MACAANRERWVKELWSVSITVCPDCVDVAERGAHDDEEKLLQFYSGQIARAVVSAIVPKLKARKL